MLVGDFSRTSWFAAGCLALASGFTPRAGFSEREMGDNANADPRGRNLALHGRASKPVFSPDGKLMATVGTDGMVTLWDVATAEPAGPPLELGHEVTTGIWK